MCGHSSNTRQFALLAAFQSVACQVLAESPPTIFINHSHLIVTQTVEVIFLQVHLRIVDEKLSHFGSAVIEHRSDVFPVLEIETRLRQRFLPVKEANTLVVQVVCLGSLARGCTGMVEDHVGNDRDIEQMAEINKHFELIDLAGQF